MAALAAVDEEEAMAIEVDDDEVPTQGKRKRNTLPLDRFMSLPPTSHVVPNWMTMTLCSLNSTRFMPSSTRFLALIIHVYTSRYINL
jgi:hypothetical protein